MNAPSSLDRLTAVHEPVVVGVPPANARRDLMRLPDGELRHYGFKGVVREGTHVGIYIVSHDHGFSWQERRTPPGSPGGCVRSPWSGQWITVLATRRQPDGSHGTDYHGVHLDRETGTYVYRSTEGPDGPWSSERICEETLNGARQPIALHARDRWLAAGHIPQKDGGSCPAVVLSDDDGCRWRLVRLPPLPRFELKWPHRGMRWWRCGDEPTVAELPDHRLYMLIRTAHDQLWESWSEDGGDHWTEPAPSRFHATITTPLLHRLADGRLLAVWNNTRPLPELDHDTQPELNAQARSGYWEDVMTNRDAIHAAVSDDGRQWRGFRELLLNERRNDADFRSSGGTAVSIDKGLNQSQAVNLPRGKVLLAVGQHPRCRRLLLFSPDWLLETDRDDEFRTGLDHWSVHQYLKSLAGAYRGFSGHCSFNRRVGPALVPDPAGRHREVLRIGRHPDPRVLHEREGAVWNFPAGRHGRLRVRLQLAPGSAGARISLLDHWTNPSDPVVEHDACLVLDIGPDGAVNGTPALVPGRWHDLVVHWNLDGDQTAHCRVDDQPRCNLAWRQPCPDGLSYLHLQSAADHADPYGLLVEAVAKDDRRPLEGENGGSPST